MKASDAEVSTEGPLADAFLEMVRRLQPMPQEDRERIIRSLMVWFGVRS